MRSGWRFVSRTVRRLGPYRPVVELADRTHAHLLLVDRAGDRELRVARLLRRDLAARADVAGEFLRVGRALAGIRHPNVCAVHDAGAVAGGQPYMVLDHLHGRELGAAVVGTAHQRHATIVHLGLQIAGGLAAAHDAGVLHLDLTPDSAVLVGDRDQWTVKLCNFEVAAVTRRWLSSGPDGAAGIVGAPAYWSPEIAKGTEVDARSDIYSLGVILFELVTGRVPFRGQSVDEVIAQHVYAETPSLEPAPGVSPAIGSVVERCLAKDPADRFVSAHEVCAALRSVARDERSVAACGARGATGEASASGRRPPATPPIWRSSMVIGFLAAAIALTVGLWTARTAGRATPVAKAPTRTVRVVVTSDPPGALVHRASDGVELGRTPLTVNLPRSDRPLELVVRFADGHRQRLRIVPDRSLGLHAGPAG